MSQAYFNSLSFQSKKCRFESHCDKQAGNRLVHVHGAGSPLYVQVQHEGAEAKNQISE